MQLALVLSSRCNALCTHCSTDCGPRRREELSIEDLTRLMDEAAAIDDGEDLEFHFTGGEPFLDFTRLQAAVAHASSLHARVSCTTNAFWARSWQAAFDKLQVLRAAGLTTLSVSVSRFHQQYVPLQNARWALEAARALAIESELKGAVINSDLVPNGTLAQWREVLDADQIRIFPVLPCLREGAYLPEHEYYRKRGLPTQRCPDEILCVEPDGAVMSCCGQRPQSGFLRLGSVHDDDVSTLRQRMIERGKQRILRQHGPIAFARAAIAAGLSASLRTHYAGPCDLCVHVATDPNLRRVADDLSAAAEATRRPTARDSSSSLHDRHTPITRRPPMSYAQLQQILEKAGMDLDARQQLVDSREELDLPPGERAVLQRVREQLRRFPSDATLTADAARYWAIGLLVAAIAEEESTDWTVNMKSIPRRTVPRKGKKKRWKVNEKSIPRRSSSKPSSTKTKRAKKPSTKRARAK